MYQLEHNIVNILEDLKQNHHAIGVKTEFGEEAATVEETLRLKMFASRFDMNCRVKISGCEAIKDIFDAKSVGADSILAPMIESPYAAEKFINSMHSVLSPERLQYMKLYINIETIDGFKNLDRIVETEAFDSIDGIVFGRTDFVKSVGMYRNYVDSEIVFDYVDKTAKKCESLGKEFIIGGGVSPKSMPFFKKINQLSQIETRKIIFDSQSLLNDPNAEECINKAVQFEIFWLQNKQNMFGILSQNDKNRIEILKTRCNFVNLCK